MDSVVFRFLDKNRDPGIAIGNYEFYKGMMKTAKQLVEVVGWKHTEQQREDMMNLEQEDLLELLNMIMDNNVLCVEHPC